MNYEKQYSFKFVETVINLMESLSPNTRDEVFEWASKNDRSGIDSWRDFVIEHAENFEKITADIDWNDNPPTDYIDAIDAYGEMVDDVAPVREFPTKEDLLGKISEEQELGRLAHEEYDLEQKLRLVRAALEEFKNRKGGNK
jgi:hypothetical protein